MPHRSREDGLGQYHLVPIREPLVDREGEMTQHRSAASVASNFARRFSHEQEPQGCAEIVMRSVFFQVSTVILIAANAVCIGLETDMPDLWFWGYLEWTFLVFFAFELSLRLIVVTPRKFFCCEAESDAVWNIFDFALVVVGFLSNLICLIKPKHSFGKADTTLFRIVRLFRLLRILRVVRVFRFLKQLYLLAYGFFEGAMAVFWVAVLASSIMYCCSIILVRVYGSLPDEDGFISQRFTSVPQAMFTLFQIMCSPSLHDYKDVMYDYPALVVFIIVYVIFGSFGINGLLTGVISESILDKNQARVDEQRLEREAKRRNLHKDSSELFDMMDEHEAGSLTCEEIIKFKDTIHELCRNNGVTFLSHDLDHMFDVMDYDDNGVIEKAEFVSGILELCDEIRPMSIMELNSLVSRSLAKISRCDNKVDTMVRSVEELAVARRHEAERADLLAVQTRDLLDGHKRALEEQDAAAKLQKCESIMHKMKDLVMDMSLKATSEAQATESLASQLHVFSPSLSPRFPTKPRRRHRLDPNKFQSAPDYNSETQLSEASGGAQELREPGLASQLQIHSARVYSKTRRRGRLDPHKFQTSPGHHMEMQSSEVQGAVQARNEPGAHRVAVPILPIQSKQSPSEYPAANRRQRRSKSHDFTDQPRPQAVQHSPGTPRGPHAAHVKFSSCKDQGLSCTKAEACPIPHQGILRSKTLPDLPVPVILPGNLDGTGQEKDVQNVVHALSRDVDGLDKHAQNVVCVLSSGADGTAMGAKLQQDPTQSRYDASHVSELLVQRASAKHPQAFTGESCEQLVQALPEKSCERLVQETMQHVDALSQIQEALRSAHGSTMGEACDSIQKAISCLSASECQVQDVQKLKSSEGQGFGARLEVMIPT